MVKFHIIESGYFKGDGGVMFGPLPKKYWQSRYEVDDKNMCPMALRCLLIVTPTKRIVVDCGIGTKHDRKIRFYQPTNQNPVVDAIEALGYAPQSITDVVFTHLHFDHCGGATRLDADGSVVPCFPNAVHHVSKKQWNNYRNPSLFDKESYFADNVEPLWERGLIELISDDTQLDADVRLELYDGHTPGQIVVTFDTSEGKFAFPADVAPTALHLSLSCLSAYDNNLVVAMDEKKRFLDKARRDNRTIIFYHDAFKPMTTL